MPRRRDLDVENEWYADYDENGDPPDPSDSEVYREEYEELVEEFNRDGISEERWEEIRERLDELAAMGVGD